MVLRHLGSVVLALGLTPVGVLVFDYGAGKYYVERARNFDNSGAAGELLLMLVGALVLLAVAATARLSGLGPVLAGLVWGLVPFAWFLADIESFFDFTRDLPSTYYWFASPSYLFPLVAAMLVGAGLAGRWRGRLRVAQ
jgi:hypothetical protein